ncbi:unnamed protein product [Polarella glacialis]|uniref:Uncharacterized protein n=1 Tax=Polarella glacialis TaxID=89957 RepID=A0A813HDY9_POLGL|nr:unnamed protein product [Polarella glacialis]
MFDAIRNQLKRCMKQNANNICAAVTRLKTFVFPGSDAHHVRCLVVVVSLVALSSDRQQTYYLTAPTPVTSQRPRATPRRSEAAPPEALQQGDRWSPTSAVTVVASEPFESKLPPQCVSTRARRSRFRYLHLCPHTGSRVSRQ